MAVGPREVMKIAESAQDLVLMTYRRFSTQPVKPGASTHLNAGVPTVHWRTLVSIGEQAGGGDHGGTASFWLTGNEIAFRGHG